jgi:Fe2+ or Zn2+ uptake regulation protein
MSKSNFSPDETFKSVLRKAGYKATPARLGVMRVMKNAKNPLSAQEVIERLSEDFDHATVYRTIKALKHSGIIKPIDLRHNHAHYEFTDLTDHHHLVCAACGRIEDIEGCDIEEMYKSILRAAGGFAEIRQHALEFFGTCKRCVRAKPSGKAEMRSSEVVRQS